MAEESFKRKLTAILSADVKGYSRLMGDDEAATVRTLTAYREAMATLIQQHRGRVVDSPGDNILAEFASVVDALECAVEVQEESKARNADLPENRKMVFRTGINLGDVIEDGKRIYGDGINIAARIEGLADGGGICISGTVYDQVRNKLSLDYDYMGEQSVKNIPEPVRVYRVLMEPRSVAPLISEEKVISRRRPRAVMTLGVILFVVIAALFIWHYVLRPSPSVVEVSSGVGTEMPSQGKPSIAVLPFENLGGDPEQEYFSDGITNDIITDLSKFSEMFVIASNTVFTYKGKRIKVKDVGRELGVRYVLEGSVQRAKKKVRVNVQLINANTGHHLWAERYDRDLKDLFGLQDEIIQTIVTTLGVKIQEAERKRAMRKDTDSLKAQDYVWRGRHYLLLKKRSEIRKAKKMFEKAIELDPSYAMAYVGLGFTHLQRINYGWTEFPNKALQEAQNLARKALSIEASNTRAHLVLGTVYVFQKQYDLATSELQRAIELNPNDALSRANLGWVMLWSGKAEEAIQLLEDSFRFDPNSHASRFMHLGFAFYLLGRYEDSIRTLKRGIARGPDFVGNHIVLAAAYAQSGRPEEASREAAIVLRLNPFFNVESHGKVFKNPSDRAKIVEGLRKAGLK